MSRPKQIKIHSTTDELLKIKFPELKIGLITYNDAIRTALMGKKRK